MSGVVNEEMSARSADLEQAAHQQSAASAAYGTFSGRTDDGEDVESKDEWAKIKEEYGQAAGPAAWLRRLPPSCWLATASLSIVVIGVLSICFAEGMFAGGEGGGSKPQAVVSGAKGIKAAVAGKNVAEEIKPPLTEQQKDEVQKLARKQVLLPALKC